VGKRYRDLSDSQANAEALARRSAPYSAASDMSARIAWDYRNREPADLREAVYMVQKAYADEVPDKLHDGPDAIGEGGTPRMTARAEGYIFGSGDSDDAPIRSCVCHQLLKCKEHPSGGWDHYHSQHEDMCPRNPQNQELVGYYHTPFRAALGRMQRGAEAERKRAAIVSHVTIGQQGPQEAAITEGVPAWCAKLVAEDALRMFLRGLSDMKLHIPRPDLGQEATTAA
jgi:hypothetical protein